MLHRSPSVNSDVIGNLIPGDLRSQFVSSRREFYHRSISLHRFSSHILLGRFVELSLPVEMLDLVLIVRLNNFGKLLKRLFRNLSDGSIGDFQLQF